MQLFPTTIGLKLRRRHTDNEMQPMQPFNFFRFHVPSRSSRATVAAACTLFPGRNAREHILSWRAGGRKKGGDRQKDDENLKERQLIKLACDRFWRR